MFSDKQNWATRIPTELWQDVFNHATWIPGAFDLYDHEAIAVFTSTENASLKDRLFHSAMQSNIAVSLVSKKWHSMVQRFMFRYILFRSGDQVQRLADVLYHYDAEGLQMPCRWTCRLEVSLHDWHIWTYTHTEALIRIIKRCNNLAIFSTAHCKAQSCYFCASIGFVLGDICVNSGLRRLELKDSQLMDTSIFQGSENALEVLYIGHSRTEDLHHRTLALRLPKLHTLITGFAVGSRLVTDWVMPSLRALNVYESVAKSFSSQVGQHLRSLVLRSPCRLAHIFDLCPNLQEVDIDFGCGHTPIPVVTHATIHMLRHLSIRQIVLRNLLLDTSSSLEFPDKILRATSSGAVFPSLQCIRLAPYLQITRTQPQLQDLLRGWHHCCTVRGIVVQHCHHEGGGMIWLPFSVDTQDATM